MALLHIGRLARRGRAKPTSRKKANSCRQRKLRTKTSKSRNAALAQSEGGCSRVSAVGQRLAGAAPITRHGQELLRVRAVASSQVLLHRERCCPKLPQQGFGTRMKDDRNCQLQHTSQVHSIPVTARPDSVPPGARIMQVPSPHR